MPRNSYLLFENSDTIRLGSATGMLIFGFVPICIADSGTLQIAVIGPMSGKDHSISLEAGKIYNEYGIPAVTASATAPEVTEGNDWYFRVVPDTNLQGKFTALYIKNILEKQTVYIVFEQDAYSTTLQRSFERASRDSGLQIKNTWRINSEIDEIDRKCDTITHELQHDPKPGALFVALQVHEAAKLVRSIRDAGLDLSIMGGDAIGSESFQRQFVKIPSKTRGPGHYTDGIYAATFFISDISNRKARQFSRTFKRRFGKQPDDMAPTHYDAAAIAVEAIKQAKIEINVAQSRKNIRNRLRSFRYIETAHKKITGRIFLTSTAMS